MRHGLAVFLLALTFSAAHAGDDWQYVVRAGDTLSHIAERHLDNTASWRELQRINKVTDPNRLKPGSTLRIPYALSGGSVLFAEATWIRGEVQRIAGGTATPLTPGTQLRIGEMIATGAQSSATLRFADQSRLMVAPNSRVLLTHMLRDRQSGQVATTLMLEAGAVESLVQRGEKIDARYEVKTPTLNLAVRGTRFRVVVDSTTGMTRSEVEDGKVLASAQGQEVALAAGQGTYAAKGAAPSPARDLLPAPTLLAAAAQLEILPIRFDWRAAAEARQYRIELLDRDGANQVDELVSMESRARWASLPDGEYQLRVRAIDASGLEGRPAVHAFALNGKPAPPILRHPLVGTSLGGEKVAFRWARPLGSQHFRLQVSDTADFARIVAQVKQLPGAVGGIDFTLPPGRYFWRVAASHKEAGWGPDSAVASFELQAGAGVALPSAEQAVQLAWRAGSEGQKVQLQVASDAQFRQLLLDVTQTESRANFVPPGKGPYFLRLRRIDPDGLATTFETAQQMVLSESR
jgi:hypothetical protein